MAEICHVVQVLSDWDAGFGWGQLDGCKAGNKLERPVNQEDDLHESGLELVSGITAYIPSFGSRWAASLILWIEKSSTDTKVVNFQESLTRMGTLDAHFTSTMLIDRFWGAVSKTIMNYSDAYLYTLCFLAHSQSGSLSSMVYPLSAVGYALVVRPRPPVSYWVFMIAYSGLLICVKLVLSFRIWCISDVDYTLQYDEVVCPNDSVHTPDFTEWPVVIGLFPGNRPGYFLWECQFDVLILLCAILRKCHLLSIGEWLGDPRGYLNMIARKTDTMIATSLAVDAMHVKHVITLQRWWRRILNSRKGDFRWNTGSGLNLVESSDCRPKPESDPVAEAYNNFYYAQDTYMEMSACQMLGFFFMVIFYPTLSPYYVDYYTTGAISDVVTVFNMDSIDIDYLGCLICLFSHIVVDRVIYLTTNRRWKIMNQIFSTLLLHLCMLVTFKLQARTPAIRQFFLVCFYLIECGYLYHSACQIQRGYTTETQKDFLLSKCESQVPPRGRRYTREELLHSVELKPGRVAYYSYMVFRVVPFMFEMKCILDWWFIPTTLELIEYIKLQDLHGTILAVAYTRTFESEWKRYVGEQMLWWYKHLAGGLVFIGLCALIW